jgi:hypothetical protein
MLPTKFHIIWLRGFREEDLKSKLTFKATAFEAGSDNTYSVNIKAEFRFMVFSGVETLAAVVIENAANVWNDDNNSMLVINNFITFIENPLNNYCCFTVNKNGFNELIFGRRKFTMSGKDVNKFTISDEDLKSKLTFKATAFEAGLVLEIVYVSGKHNHLICVFRRRNINRGNMKCWYMLPIVRIYSVNIKAEFRFMTGPSSVAYTQTTEKTIT